MNDIGWEKYSQVAVSRTEEGSRAVRLDEALALATVLLVELKDLLVLDATVTKLRELTRAVSNIANREIRPAIRRYEQAQEELQDAVSAAIVQRDSDSGDTRALNEAIERAERYLGQPYQAFFRDRTSFDGVDQEEA